MAENKTQPTEASVLEFLENVTPETKKTDSLFLLDWLEKVTGFSPKMWGPSIIGYGSYHYKYASGREGDAPLIGFSPRKNALTLYVTFYESEKPQDLSKLGKFTQMPYCLIIRLLSRADLLMYFLPPMIMRKLLKQ